MSESRPSLPHDWFSRGIPSNVRIGDDVYVDSSYSFDGVVSQECPAIQLGDATGAYDRAGFLVGPHGSVVVGKYTVLNACYLICESRITIGDHCLLAWGAVITDIWPGAVSLQARRGVLQRAFVDGNRWLDGGDAPRPVTLADNVWIGFDAVVMPGTTIGRGAVVSSRSVVSGDIPPYAVVVGNPGRVIRMLEPDDTDDARRRAFGEYLRPRDG